MEAKRMLFILLAYVCVVNAEFEEITTTVKPIPYVFSYKAGRFPGHLDRTHTEVSDGSGTVRGSFSYVDPRNQVRTVDYVANEHGFYPSLSHPAPADTEAVNNAKAKHYALYTQIAEEHAAAKSHPVHSYYPQDTEAVNRAREKHLSLFEKIAADHARIAAEREAEQLAKKSQNPNELYEDV